VVLQRFRGELTMLDGRGDGGGAFAGGDAYGQTEQRGGGSASQLPAGDLDDEIPF
jgi:single-strand DNA-binding protein